MIGKNKENEIYLIKTMRKVYDGVEAEEKFGEFWKDMYEYIFFIYIMIYMTFISIYIHIYTYLYIMKT